MLIKTKLTYNDNKNNKYSSAHDADGEYGIVPKLK